MATALELQHFAVLSIAFYHQPISLYLACPTNNPCHLTCYYTDNKPIRHATSRVVRGAALPWGAYWCFSGWKTVEQEEDGDTINHTFFFPEWPKCSLIGTPWTNDFTEDLAILYEPWGSHLHDYNLWFIIADPEIPVITFPDENIHIDFLGCHHAGVQWIETDGYLPLEGPDKAPCYFYGDTLELIPGWHWTAIAYGFYCKGNGEDMLLYLTLTKNQFTLFPDDSGFFIERGIHVGYQHIETGPVKFNLLELWKATRSHFGLDTNYENWYVSQYEIACRDGAPVAASSIKNAVFALYYPPPKPPLLRWFTFRGTVEDELSPSVTALMSHCHPGVSALETTIPIAHDNNDYRRLNSVYQACPSVCPPILEAGYFYAIGKHTGCGLRFLFVNIPRYATILEAKLIFTASQDMAGTCRYTRISAEQEDNPPDFSLDDWLSARTRWQNSGTAIDWDVIPAWTQDEEYTSPDLSFVIQELVNRPLWNEGNAAVLFWNDWDERAGNLPYTTRRAYSHNVNPAKAVKLYVRWKE